MLPNSIVLSRTAEVVVTATGGRRRSVNKKTGDMIQIQAAPTAVDPVTAGNSGHQKLVCFDCPIQALCYVNKGHAPLAVWQATKAQPPIDLSVWDSRGKPVRLGSWGDPAAMSTEVLETVTAGLHTGYTHQWRKRSDLSEICMASVETPAQREEATALGWRTFRPIIDGQAPDTGEILCPYVSTGGKVQCSTCLLCSGRRSQAKDIVVPIHGTHKRAGKAYLQAL